MSCAGCSNRHAPPSSLTITIAPTWAMPRRPMMRGDDGFHVPALEQWACICSSSRPMRASALPMAAMASSSTTRWAAMRQDEFAQVAPVGFRSTRFCRCSGSRCAAKRRLQLRSPAPQVLHGVGARAAQVAHGLVVGIRHVHRRQLPRAVQARQLQRVAPVGLDALAAPARGNERRGHDGAVRSSIARSRRAMTKPVGPAS